MDFGDFAIGALALLGTYLGSRSAMRRHLERVDPVPEPQVVWQWSDVMTIVTTKQSTGEVKGKHKEPVTMLAVVEANGARRAVWRGSTSMTERLVRQHPTYIKLLAWEDGGELPEPEPSSDD